MLWALFPPFEMWPRLLLPLGPLFKQNGAMDSTHRTVSPGVCTAFTTRPLTAARQAWPGLAGCWLAGVGNTRPQVLQPGCGLTVSVTC